MQFALLVATIQNQLGTMLEASGAGRTILVAQRPQWWWRLSTLLMSENDSRELFVLRAWIIQTMLVMQLVTIIVGRITWGVQMPRLAP